MKVLMDLQYIIKWHNTVTDFSYNTRKPMTMTSMAIDDTMRLNPTPTVCTIQCNLHNVAKSVLKVR